MTDALLIVSLLFLGVVTCVFYWVYRYAWFAENRKMNDTVSRSETSWNKDHEFFDTITEFHDDFN